MDAVGERTSWFKPMPEWERVDGEFHLVYPEKIPRDMLIDVTYCTFHHGSLWFKHDEIKQIVLSGDYEAFKKKYDFFKELQGMTTCEYLPYDFIVFSADGETELGRLCIAFDDKVFGLINGFECEHG